MTPPLTGSNFLRKQVASGAAGFSKLTRAEQRGVLRKAAQKSSAIRTILSDEHTALSREEQRSALRAIQQEQKKREALERTIVAGREAAVRHRQEVAERGRLYAKQEQIQAIQRGQEQERQQEKRALQNATIKKNSDDVTKLANTAIDLPI